MNNIKVAKRLIKLAKELLESQSDIINDFNIKKELKKIHIKEYQSFKMIKPGEWRAYPINRNANLP
jgi:hypothetical protein